MIESHLCVIEWLLKPTKLALQTAHSSFNLDSSSGVVHDVEDADGRSICFGGNHNNAKSPHNEHIGT
jgi:hypothetical protein